MIILLDLSMVTNPIPKLFLEGGERFLDIYPTDLTQTGQLVEVVEIKRLCVQVKTPKDVGADHPLVI